jgi:hypothetical protein
MGFFDRVFGRRKDPTADWPAFSLPIPEYDVAELTFGSLRFGDAIEKASFLGRPDLINWIESDHCELVYGRGGFHLYFAGGEFSSIAFFIAEDEDTPDQVPMHFCRPVLRGSVPYGTQLTPEVDVSKLHSLFGSPESVEHTEEDHSLFYTRSGADMEFELDDNGKLKGWNIYRPR